MPRGENLSRDRKPGPGRPRGLQNKITVELKQMIEGALEEVGGQKYLVSLARKRPEVFCQLLVRLLPKAVELGFNGSLDVNLYQERLETARRKAAEAKSHGN
jgi:hypothetical protein